MSLEVLDRHSEALFEFLWCPVCGQEVFTTSPSRGCFARTATPRSNSRNPETRGYEDAVLACFDSTTTWNLHIDEKTAPRPA